MFYEELVHHKEPVLFFIPKEWFSLVNTKPQIVECEIYFIKPTPH